MRTCDHDDAAGQLRRGSGRGGVRPVGTLRLDACTGGAAGRLAGAGDAARRAGRRARQEALDRRGGGGRPGSATRRSGGGWASPARRSARRLGRGAPKPPRRTARRATGGGCSRWSARTNRRGCRDGSGSPAEPALAPCPQRPAAAPRLLLLLLLLSLLVTAPASPAACGAGGGVVQGAGGAVVEGRVRSRYAGAMLLHASARDGPERAGRCGGRPACRRAAAGGGQRLHRAGKRQDRAVRALAAAEAGPLAGLAALPDLRTLRPALAGVADPRPLRLQRLHARDARRGPVTSSVYYVDDHFVRPPGEARRQG